MARRVSTGTPEAVRLRARLLEKYERLAKPHPPLVEGGRPLVDDRSARLVRDLRAGRAVVLAGWELHAFDLPAVRRGVHAFYRVGRNGRVVEVERSEVIVS